MIVDYQVSLGNHRLHSYTGGEASKPWPTYPNVFLDQSSQAPAVKDPTISIGVSDGFVNLAAFSGQRSRVFISGANI
jgi:hypothetical protein